jgi:predicted Zn finger-like uncharacterized protein
MKFSCEACAARYYMDDDKVRHKTLRIRCKKCGNVMTVGDGETTLSEQGSGPDLASVAPREQLQPTADSIWFYAAAGQTYGPYAEGELLRRFETGRIAEEVHVWKQGFAAWLPAGEVEAFSAAIQQARPGRQLTQSIDIGALNLAPVGSAGATPYVGDAEAKARLTALRDGLRKSRGAESGTSIKPQTPSPTSPSSAEAAAGFEVSDLLDGSIADATASLIAKAQAAPTTLAPESASTATSEPRPVEAAATKPISAESEVAPVVEAVAPAAEPAHSNASSPAAAAPAPSNASSIPRLPVLADAALLPQGQGPTSGAMASALGGAPTASLMLQIEQSKSANRTRIFIGGGVVALAIGAGLFGMRGSKEPPAPPPTAEVRKTVPSEATLTPEQAALKAERTDSGVAAAKDQVRSALREGASSAVTAIMKTRMAEDAARKKRGMAAVQRTTKVVFNEATGSIAEADINAPEQPPVASASSRARGIGVAIAAPKLGRVSSPAALPPSYFAAGLRKVEESIQYCNQRQLSAEGRLRKPRVELKFSIMPSGRVSAVDFNNEVAATTFAGCMRGRKDRWLFGAFEGDPLQVAKTYIVE